MDRRVEQLTTFIKGRDDWRDAWDYFILLRIF